APQPHHSPPTASFPGRCPNRAYPPCDGRGEVPSATPQKSPRSFPMLRALARLFGPGANSTPRGRRARKARPALEVESLEGSCVPATLQVVNGVLTYTAGAGVANNLSLATNVAGYIFRDTAETINVIGIPDAVGSGTNTVLIYGGQVPLAGLSIN